MNTTTMRIDRFDLPATPQPGSDLIDRWDTYATVSLRDITAHIERFTYWRPRDNEPEPDVLLRGADQRPPQHGRNLRRGDAESRQFV